MSLYGDLLLQEMAPTLEFKGDAETYYSSRRHTDRMSGNHDNTNYLKSKTYDDSTRDGGGFRHTIHNMAEYREHMRQQDMDIRINNAKDLFYNDEINPVHECREYGDKLLTAIMDAM